ncbi:unnamed protein product [Nezara viridula]|uniref:Uncharacterized protein n=1 Tax=Nezara viridula TaxID=85310 RepID=A0A9P0HTD6_NEZVI|nr:unnamed protein product [Nezara viridula]
MKVSMRRTITFAIDPVTRDTVTEKIITISRACGHEDDYTVREDKFKYLLKFAKDRDWSGKGTMLCDGTADVTVEKHTLQQAPLRHGTGSDDSSDRPSGALHLAMSDVFSSCN